jgi:hypothetical protein
MVEWGGGDMPMRHEPTHESIIGPGWQKQAVRAALITRNDK